MFSGIVEATGTVVATREAGGLMKLNVNAPAVLMDADSMQVGDSISVSGACLTVTNIDGSVFSTDVTLETLRRTALSDLQPGSRVNLERAMKFGGRVGGHLVQGHVDGVGIVAGIKVDGAALLIRVEASADIITYTIEKGYVALDGVSLTCFSCDDSGFHFTLIPHTAAVTTLGDIEVGARLNIEADMAAKYLEKFTYSALEARSVT